VHAETLLIGIKQHGHKHVYYHPQKDELVDHLLELVKPGDVVITLGAGDIWKVGTQLLNKLKSTV
jgi:UDP-N-acetylmuramate--alanine ligase